MGLCISDIKVEYKHDRRQLMAYKVTTMMKSSEKEHLNINTIKNKDQIKQYKNLMIQRKKKNHKLNSTSCEHKGTE